MIRFFLDLLFPPRCVLCHKFLPDSRQPVCDSCGRFVLGQSVQTVTGKHFTRCVAPLTYEEPVRGAVHRFKFGGRGFYAKIFGAWMAACVSMEGLEWDVLTWVPVSAARRRKRGYDQAQLLCRSMAKHLGAAETRCLKKVRNNPAQSGFAAREARERNVKGVYRAVKPENFCGKRVLLVDDVITTGATLEECSRVLRACGAASVACAVLARAN